MMYRLTALSLAKSNQGGFINPVVQAINTINASAINTYSANIRLLYPFFKGRQLSPNTHQIRTWKNTANVNNALY